MLRVIGLIVGLALLVLVAGCGNSSESPTTSASASGPTSTVAATTETTAPVEITTTSETTAVVETTTTAETSGPPAQKFGATVDLGDLLITVQAPVDDTANLDATTKELMLGPGQKAVYCMVSIVNNGSQTFAYDSAGFTMFDAEGLTYESLFPVSTQPDLGSGDLLPGRTVKGAISWAMEKAATPAYVNFQRSATGGTEASWGN